QEALRLAASAETASEHPLGEAVVRHALDAGLELEEPSEFESVTGRGVDAMVGGLRVLVGSRDLMAERGVTPNGLGAAADRLETEAKTALWVARSGAAVGVIGVADTIKAGSQEAVADLRRMGLQVAMITGDNRHTAEAIARAVGIETVFAGVLPGDKAGHVKRLQAEGNSVAMVGDGINDAPALAQADVGVAIGTGTDVAIEASDVTLMRGDLRGLPEALRLGRATIKTIRENLVWAFGYNTVLIPVAAGILHPFQGVPGILRELHPIMAALAMAFSSVSVVTNSLRLRSARIDGGGRGEAKTAVSDLERRTQ
ncbi:MAG: HAD-IC family P-type ATPase, partial [Anaerolineae bacterium]